MKALFLPVAFAALTSAAPFPEVVRPITTEPAIDGYVFQQKAFDRLSLILIVVEHKTREDLRAAWIRLYPKSPPPTGLLAFARWNDRACEINIIDPGVRYEPHIIGHELAHCLHGDFHPGQESAR